ncbi:flavodoxin [Candidatus Steffania adelgidicola]|uniref:flavodoxin n=1 Tax=Candidatus Steffania adelgidicola TaxID=1076626 RepID=UPI001D023E51|nr:flavodoxin [Candidatus Steffania adelgidicola]UDG79527.1 hypothetical protein GFK82_00023 [Candidatus Steffania adelgidicola]
MAHIGIFVGTVYGNALCFAEKVEELLRQQSYQVTLFQDGCFNQWQMYADQVILIVTSTTGQGELPENIQLLFQEVKYKFTNQSTLRYGIIALGDSSYNIFCGAGYTFDTLLQEKGATRIGNILTIDCLKQIDPEMIACRWAIEWGACLYKTY